MKLERVAVKELNSKSKMNSEIAVKELNGKSKSKLNSDSKSKTKNCQGNKKTTRSRRSRSKKTLASIQESNDFNLCFVCGEPGTEPPTEEWIQCGECSSWFHEQCANIEGGIFECEKCGLA